MNKRNILYLIGAALLFVGIVVMVGGLIKQEIESGEKNGMKSPAVQRNASIVPSISDDPSVEPPSITTKEDASKALSEIDSMAQSLEKDELSQ